MNAPVDAAVLVLCPELLALVTLERALLDAAASFSLAVSGGPEVASARLILTALIDELVTALRGYSEARVASVAARLPF
ncbi:MAG: hypothetical protein H6721_00055 [Sandaracinus sp.]|nr:hypothetical protein [Sandaracinus sp.]MCB9753586.1 hypothetical protein [Myxococcales bacterium]